jgi:hypothetical protein
MAWGGEDPEIYTGRDWHTDQGQHTFDFTLCADQDLEPGNLNILARQQAQPPVGEQPSTLPVARLGATRGGGRTDAYPRLRVKVS